MLTATNSRTMLKHLSSFMNKRNRRIGLAFFACMSLCITCIYQGSNYLAKIERRRRDLQLENFNKISSRRFSLQAHELAFLQQERARNFSDTSQQQEMPTIFVVTPTYTRLEQKADLTRMRHTLKLVRNLHWIVVEDSEFKTDLVENLLKDSDIPYTHLSISSEKKALRDKDGRLRQRGLEQRNLALKWLRTDPYPIRLGGVLFFGDDDNTYSLRLFDEMRHTKNISVWPVGLLGGLRYETPIVQNNKVVGWVAWNPFRKFAIDMCGFGVNLQMVFDNPNVWFSYAKPGRLESNFILSFGITLDDLEPKAKLCTEILVWHTRTQKTNVREKSGETFVFVKKGIENRTQLIEKFTSAANFEV